MRTAVSLFLPRWSSDLARLRWRLDASRVVLLTRIDHQREVVDAACARASAAGVAPGMTLAHARALLPRDSAWVETRDLAHERRALRRLAGRATRLIPIVEPDEPGGLLLDASGCERMYGGAASIVARVRGWARGLGFAARVAAAPTFGAAWALARYGATEELVVGVGGLDGALAPLPVAALGLEAACVERLREVGVERIGELLALPREGVASRYGDAALRALDRALGRGAEALRGVHPRDPITAAIELDGPTDRVEAVELCARRALAGVIEEMRRRECGCRRIVITLDRSDLAPAWVEARVSAPTRDGRHWWALLRDKVAGAHLGFGVEAVRAWASHCARLAHEQRATTRPDREPPDDALVARLADTMIARLGRSRILTPWVVESPTPERAAELLAWSGERGSAALPGLAGADRPPTLRERPLPVRVTLLAPEGPILLVHAGGAGERVVASVGPERIEGEWWRGDGATRDYYALALEGGRRLWVFRQTPGDGWFLHGEWA